jgi:alkyl hydroperoxide reductase subunit AhpC
MRWSKDIEETQGHAVTYPMIGDPELKVATAYDMLPEGAGTTSQGRTATDNATVRSVFVVGPDKKVKAMLNWKQGQEVIIVPAVSDEDAKKTYPAGWKSPKPYLRIVPQPK